MGGTLEDIFYVEQRNKLIAGAESQANYVAGPMPKICSPEWYRWAASWNRVFHGEMERRWKARRTP